MKGKHGETGAEAVVGDGSTRTVRVMRVSRSRGAQVLDCYSADLDEGFVFVVAADRPRIEVDDLGVITRRGNGWDFAKGVGP